MKELVKKLITIKENHAKLKSYASKESIYHVLWEQDQWLEKYVKKQIK